MALGPVAFVPKQSDGPDLLKAIGQVLQGKSNLPPKLLVEDWISKKARAMQYSEKITSRRRDVVRLFAEGRSVKEIATLLELGEKSVEFQKDHIMELFNLRSNADPVLFALKRALIPIDREPSIKAKAAHGHG